MSLFDALKNPIDLAGRLLIAFIFVFSGWGKLTAYSGTAAYMASHGVPTILLPLVILTELGGGLLIAFGYQTRLIAFLMAGFAVLTALFFHFHPGDQAQMINFMKNLSIAGGFLFLAANGAGAWSLDGLRARAGVAYPA
ncbi:putative oxidoreductase [Breoghania corrubedonensis]|uniref:Putative oxidoreductase n=1 Tax=Breoghania corrubedonensis TaxID=665038 RepID=A0A2T5VCW2_9HYPH|nr:DoxX family protein [Breoghania corrubedonensis]PTW61588.1 putative oxidoreductase [Breoghania corrubedonensis]